MKQIPNRPKAQTGVVARVQVPPRMTPLTSKPLQTNPLQTNPLQTNPLQGAGDPHYAKLRVESSGDQLYLGIFLDPLYKVHWNNKAPPLEYEIKPPPGVSVNPAAGTAAKVGLDADADPREFLVDVDGRSDKPMRITIKYFACDDAETFCKPVRQEYLVSFDRDRDGGSRRSFGSSAAHPAADATSRWQTAWPR